MKLIDILKQMLLEDRCKRIADRKYDKPSAYKSGAIVRCRKGNIWKDIKEAKQVGKLYHFTSKNNLEKILSSNKLNGSFMYELENGDELYGVSTSRNKNLFYDKNNIRITLDGDKLSNNYKIKPRDYWYREYNIPDNPQTVDEDEEVILTPNNYIFDVKKYILDIEEAENISEDESLHKWFKRSGPKGKEGGWVDCNTCKDGSCKACGRKEGEKRAKYPSCRPTPAQCKTKGKGKKWGKTK
jgi:hypothetical protein